jgi:hypothetical protein
MYKNAGRHSQRTTRSDFVVLRNDKEKRKKTKEFALFPKLEKKKKKKVSAARVEAILEKYGGRDQTKKILEILKIFDRQKIRHQRAISQQLFKLGMKNKSGEPYSAEEVRELLWLLNIKNLQI